MKSTATFALLLAAVAAFTAGGAVIGAVPSVWIAYKAAILEQTAARIRDDGGAHIPTLYVFSLPGSKIGVVLIVPTASTPDGYTLDYGIF